MRFKDLTAILSGLALSSCADPILVHQTFRPNVTIPEKKLVYDGLDINTLRSYLDTGRKVRWNVSETEFYEFEVVGKNYFMFHLKKGQVENGKEMFVLVKDFCGPLDEKNWGHIRNRFYVLNNFPAD